MFFKSNINSLLKELEERFLKEGDNDNDRKVFELANKILDCDSGNIQAKYVLAQCYHVGIGTEKDCKKSIELYKQLAKENESCGNNLDFQCKYANALEEAGNVQCLTWLLRASLNGDQYSTYRIGSLLLESDLLKDIPYPLRYELSNIYLKKASMMTDDIETALIAKNTLNIQIAENKLRINEIEKQQEIMSVLKGGAM